MPQNTGVSTRTEQCRRWTTLRTPLDIDATAHPFVHLRAPQLGTPTCRRRWRTPTDEDQRWSTSTNNGQTNVNNYRPATFRADPQPFPLRVLQARDEVGRHPPAVQRGTTVNNAQSVLNLFATPTYTGLDMPDLNKATNIRPTTTDHIRPTSTDRTLPDTQPGGARFNQGYPWLAKNGQGLAKNGCQSGSK